MGTKSAAATDALRLTRMLKALGNPVRFRIVELLAERQTCITGEIVRNTPLAQSTISQHLKVLRNAGLIQGEVEGPATCYCLDPDGFRWLDEHVREWLSRHMLERCGCGSPRMARVGSKR